MRSCHVAYGFYAGLECFKELSPYILVCIHYMVGWLKG